MAVVKADAYGHGDCQIARKLQQIGVNDFAVSNLKEAYTLRNDGIKGNILILGYTPPEYARELYEQDIIQTVVSEEYAEALAVQEIPVKCNIAIDTGMNRIGLSAKDVEKCEKIIRNYAARLNITGLFTHLCVADTENEEAKHFTKEQLCLYENLLSRVSDLNFNYNHCLNSAGGLFYQSVHTDIVRLGIVLYGLKPDYANTLPDGMKPIMQWKSVVSMVKWIQANDTVGYGRTFVANKPIKIATISTGYADGYNRLLSNNGYVLVNGEKANIVGRICMDQFMIDVTDINNITMGTEVTLIGNSGNCLYSADDMAQRVNTIGYEIVCNIGKRVPRTYKY